MLLRQLKQDLIIKNFEPNLRCWSCREVNYEERGCMPHPWSHGSCHHCCKAPNIASIWWTSILADVTTHDLSNYTFASLISQIQRPQMLLKWIVVISILPQQMDVIVFSHWPSCSTSGRGADRFGFGGMPKGYPAGGRNTSHRPGCPGPHPSTMFSPGPLATWKTLRPWSACKEWQ